MKRVVLLWLMLLLPVGPAGAAKNCKPMCKQVYFDTLLALCPVCSRDVIDTRTACFDAAPMDFENCASTCLPFPGRCTLTMECLDACRHTRSLQQQGCERRFQQQLRASCDVSLSCLVAANDAQHACRKSCRMGTPVTTTTTTTALAAAQATGCPQDTQRECVFQIAQPCYGECKHRCGHDTRARNICRRGCRNAVCTLLRGSCTDCTLRAECKDNQLALSKSYRGRCNACGDCAEQLEDAVDCETTTTSTTSTSTSSSSTASSVTTTSTSTTSSTLF